MVTRIFIDCTDTHRCRLNTGIQRVVRNIVNHCAAIAGQDLTCQPVVLMDDRYIPITAFEQSQLNRRNFSLRATVGKAYLLLVSKLSVLLPHDCRHFLTGTKHEPSLARIIVFLLSPVAWVWHKTKRLIAFSQNTPAPVLFRKGDILLLADSVWNYSPWVAVRSAKVAGARVAAIVYDIIPITHGQFFVPSSRDRFGAAIPLLFEHADTFLCISANTETQLRTYYAAQPFSQKLGPKKFGTFTLGVDLDTHNPQGCIRKKVLSVFNTDRSTYLVVGTLEPRKNHAHLLKAFHKLWNEGGRAVLLIVGRVGWMCDELLNEIRCHPEIGQQLFFMDDVSDTELDYCYTHARALLFPAVIEGFGLPIIEALSKGLPVFASDIPVFREVGGEYVAYFDHTNPVALANLLQAYEATGNYPARLPAGFTWPNWSQSTTELLTRLVNLAASK
jgi:glycosyltransferase involved in cell wall biosynthesis